jgi:hypothetical protein
MTAGAPIHVVATTIPGAREALATAAALAEGLDSRIHVIAAQSFPKKRPLESPFAPLQVFVTRIKMLVEAGSARARIIPCVYKHLMDITQLLPAEGFVIISGRSGRWWPSPEQRFAHELQGLGYHVVFVHTADQSVDL